MGNMQRHELAAIGFTAVLAGVLIAFNAVTAVPIQPTVLSYDAVTYEAAQSAFENEQTQSDGAEESDGEFPININTASCELLQKLPGIGQSKAQAIVEYREESGGFGSVEDLLYVSGIGEKTLENLKPYITV